MYVCMYIAKYTHIYVCACNYACVFMHMHVYIVSKLCRYVSPQNYGYAVNLYRKFTESLAENPKKCPVTVLLSLNYKIDTSIIASVRLICMF